MPNAFDHTACAKPINSGSCKPLASAMMYFLDGAWPRWTKQRGHKLNVDMKTQGEIEADICEGMSHFEQEYMGRGPKDIRAHLIGDLLVVRLQGVLTAAEQHLVTTVVPEKGR